MTVKDLALQLLLDYGCSLDCYKNNLHDALMDINALVTQGYKFDFSCEEIASALVAIADEQPEKKEKPKNFLMVWNTDSCTDGIYFQSLEEALDNALETLVMWAMDEMSNWEFKDFFPNPTSEQIEDWDYMIDNCYTYVVEYDKNNEVVAEHWLTDEQLREIGWLLWEDYIKEYKK